MINFKDRIAGGRYELSQLISIHEDYLKLELKYSEDEINSIFDFIQKWTEYRLKEIRRQEKEAKLINSSNKKVLGD